MKKIFNILLALLLGLSLYSCSINDKEEDFAGEYMDSVSQRATMTITKNDEGYEIIVRWANSASEETVWEMSPVVFEDDKLNYKGENITMYKYDDDGKELIVDGATAANNVGYFEIKEGKLYWTGAAQDICKSCIFEKIN